MKINPKTLLIIQLVVYISLCIFYIDNNDIHNDEASQYFISKLPFDEMIMFDTHPPLYPFLISFFDNNIILLRGISVLFGLISLIVVYNICKKIYKSEDISLNVTALMIVNPFFIGFSLMATPYMFALLLSLLSTYYFYCSMINAQKGIFYYMIYSSLMVLCHHFTIFILLAHAVYLVVLYKEKAFILTNWLFCVWSIPILLFLINAVKILLKPELNFREWSWQLPFKTMVYLFSGNSIGLAFVICLLIYVAFAFRFVDYFSITMFVVPFVTVLLICIFTNIWHDRYFFFFIPYSIMLIAVMLHKFPKKVERPIALFIIILLFYLVLSVELETFRTPLRDSLKQIGCNKTFIHASSFSFLPYEMMGCNNNLLINNMSLYHTPIVQTDKLIKNLEEKKDYYWVNDNRSGIVGNVVYNNMGLMIQYIS